MTNPWHDDWIRGRFEISIGGHDQLSRPVYTIGPPDAPNAELRRDSILLVPDRELRVKGRHLRKRIVDDSGTVASVVTRGFVAWLMERMISSGVNLAGRSLVLETGGSKYVLDRFDWSRPKLEVFAVKHAVIRTKGVMADETGAKLLVVDRKYTKDRLGFLFLGRRMHGRFEGSIETISPVPTLAALLAMHIVLRPEMRLIAGEWKESGPAG